jgi:hypothetical protein
VTDAEALAEIHRLAALPGRVVFRNHALDRMDERGATRGDVKNALRSSRGSEWQPDHQTWKVTGGTDLDGDDLTCAVDIEDDIIVVTIF